MNSNYLSYQLYILLLQTLFTIVDNSANVRCSFLIFASIVHKSISNYVKYSPKSYFILRILYYYGCYSLFCKSKL